MPVTVRELVEMPHLQLTLHAGAGGLERSVSWAHTSDIPEPWRFLVGGELLMTNGMSIPRTAAAQERFVRALVEGGAVALVIGAQMHAPPLSRKLERTCDELEFPLLWIAYPMPFVAVSHEIAEATLLEQSNRLHRTERMYRAMQVAAAGGSGFQDLITKLAGEVGCKLYVCASDTGQNWAPGLATMPPELRDACSRQPGNVRAGVSVVNLPEGGRAFVLDLPAQSDACLVAFTETTSQPDALLLQHAATICAHAVSQLRLEIEYQRRVGAEALSQMLSGEIRGSEISRALDVAGLDVRETMCVAICNDTEPTRLADLHVRLWRAELANLTVQRGTISTVLLRRSEGVLEVLDAVIGKAGRAGVSDVVGNLNRIQAAYDEARWALRAGIENAGRITLFSEASFELGPRTPAEARMLADRVLGAVLASGSSRELIETLQAFLDLGRSWQATAQQLHLHRHTVLYRIRKVEELTGLDLAETRDLALLWQAVQAYVYTRDRG